MIAHKILIIEDDAAIQKFLAYRLKKSGFIVETASDGEEGLAKAKREWPDLIVLDLGLPKMAGLEVCRAIREDQDKRFAKLPIIMLTARSDDADRVIGKVLGADSYMTKPFQPEELMQQVQRFAGRAADDDT